MLYLYYYQLTYKYDGILESAQQKIVYLLYYNLNKQQLNSYIVHLTSFAYPLFSGHVFQYFRPHEPLNLRSTNSCWPSVATLSLSESAKATRFSEFAFMAFVALHTAIITTTTMPAVLILGEITTVVDFSECPPFVDFIGFHCVKSAITI